MTTNNQTRQTPHPSKHNNNTTSKIIKNHKTIQTRLRPEDVIVSETRVNFTADSANPLNRVLFYSQHYSHSQQHHSQHQPSQQQQHHSHQSFNNNDEAPTFGLRQDQVSSLFGHNHQDHKLRVYCRDRCPRKCEALREAFRRWSSRQAGWGGAAQHSTPFKFRSAPQAATGAAAAPAIAMAMGGGGRSAAAALAPAVALSQQQQPQQMQMQPMHPPAAGDARANKRARALDFGAGPNGGGGSIPE